MSGGRKQVKALTTVELIVKPDDGDSVDAICLVLVVLEVVRIVLVPCCTSCLALRLLARYCTL